MRSAFFPFHVATTGLHAARANLNVVSHNIANAEIPGFSRQATVQSAARPLHLWDSRGMYGTGAETQGIIQHRNRFLDMKFWHQRAILGEHATRHTHLSFVETVFNNLPGAGVLDAFDQFFGRMHDLRGNAPDDTFRTNVITGADALTEMVRHNALALQRQQMDLNREVADTVMIINSLGQQIASINRQIADFERDGSNANDLRDRRNLMIDELSQFVNVEVVERDFSTPETPNDRRTTVRINGSDFVRHDMHTRLELVPRQAGQRRNEMDVDGLYDLAFEGGQGAFDIYNHALRGVLRGLIDLRDGNNTHVTIGGPNAPGYVADWPFGFFTHAPDMWTGPWPTFNPADSTTWPRWVREAGFDPGDPDTFDIFDPPFDPGDSDTWLVMGYGTFDPLDPATWPVGTLYAEDGGTTSNFKGIPFYMNQLNHLVRTFARAINEGLDAQLRHIPGTTGHVNGFDMNGDNRSALLFTYRRVNDAEVATFGPPGTLNAGNTTRLRLFQGPNGEFRTYARNAEGQIINFTQQNLDNGLIDPIALGLTPVVDDDNIPVFIMDLSGMNALNFMINPELTRNNSLLATSNHPDQGESNNEVIQGFSLVGTFPHLFREGRMEDFIIAISDHLAIDANQALNFALSFNEVTIQTHNQRLSVKGVDINEEMMDLVRFQHQFQAASRLINVIDSIYDTLINRLGSF
ncbi:MAG: flagellar hook-associated protein FlgK [Defluviitaleaceae bacterium]|nr:flagellar hook-associated protein FlgK [Defluviitaleaceae bacterium]MCL2239846.1 flagellar hook-associated protein FlgK [Defluviitaleaceae bacterium]